MEKNQFNKPDKARLNQEQYFKLNKIFRGIDQDSNGLVTLPELRAYLSGKKIYSSPAIIEKIFKDLDMDGNSDVSLQEFCHAYLIRMKNIKNQIQMLNVDISGLTKDKELVADRLNKMSDRTAENTVTSQQSQPNENLMLVVKFIKAKLEIDPKEEINHNFFVQMKCEEQIAQTLTSFNGGAPIWNQDLKLFVTKDIVDLDISLAYNEREMDYVYGETRLTVKAQGQTYKDWLKLYDHNNKQISIGQLAVEVQFMESEEAYLESRINELVSQVRSQEEAIKSLEAEHKILESIFDAETTLDPDRYLNIFRVDRDMVPENNLSRNDKIRNYAFIAMAVLAIFSSFYRADFLTLVVFMRAYQYFKVKWTKDYYWKYIVSLSVCVLYDMIWLFGIYPFDATESKYVLKVSAEKSLATFCCISSTLNLFVKVGIIIYLVLRLINKYTGDDTDNLLDDDELKNEP